MPKHEANDRGMRGYFLPEDSQARLTKLRDYMGFLSRLAEPRTADEGPDSAPEVDMEALATCLELLEEQADRVLSEVSWPAVPEPRGAERDDASDAAAEREAEADADDEDDGDIDGAGHDAELDAADEDDAELEAADECDDAPEAAAEAYDAAGKRLVFGLTLDQSDALDRLVRTISAHGNVLTMEELTELADGTVATLGDAIYDAAAAVREILDQVGTQRLGQESRSRPGVAEERALYRAGVREEQAVYRAGSADGDGDRPPVPAWPTLAHPPVRDAEPPRTRVH